MEKDSKRAVRRHHFARVKKNRSAYYSNWLRGEFAPSSRVALRVVGMLARTAAMCSCAMCGNPRRLLREKTLREISDLEFIKLFDPSAGE